MPRTKTNAGGAAAPANGSSVSKMDAVRQAFQALSWSAKPKAVQKWLRDNLKIEMRTSHISNYKSQLKKKRGRVGRPRKDAALAAAAPAARSGRRSDISLDDVKVVKDLAERLGPDQVKQLADMLAR
jgi:hypothetical protein